MQEDLTKEELKRLEAKYRKWKIDGEVAFYLKNMTDEYLCACEENVGVSSKLTTVLTYRGVVDKLLTSISLYYRYNRGVDYYSDHLSNKESDKIRDTLRGYLQERFSACLEEVVNGP